MARNKLGIIFRRNNFDFYIIGTPRINFYFSIWADSTDYSTWYADVVVSGTCDEVTGAGKCSMLNVWYVYKGKTSIPASVMSPKTVNGFEMNVIHALDSSQA